MKRILLNVNDQSTGSNPPSGYKFLGFNIDGNLIERTGATISNIGGGSTASNYESVKHGQLTTLISGSGLTEGKFYLISDYKTIYIQPDFSDKITPVSVSATLIKEGVTEPLIVFATSTNTISSQAWSTTFPDDTIYYDVTVETLFTGYVLEQLQSISTKGKIVRRIDKSGNDISFDFRNVKFKRYPSTTFNGYHYYDNGQTPQEQYVFANRDLQTNTYQNRVKNNVIKYSYNSDSDDYGVSQYGIWAVNTVLLNTDGTYANILSGFVNNLDLFGDVKLENVKITGSVFNSYFEGTNIFNGNEIKSSDKIKLCEFTGANLINNYISGIWTDCKINTSSSFEHNNIIAGAYLVDINNIFFSNNTINCSNFTRFSCTGQFRNNNINCTTLGHNTFGLTASVVNMYHNIISALSFSNFTLTSFTNNKIYDSVQNLVAYSFAFNEVNRNLSNATFNTGSTYSVNFNTFGVNITSANFTSSTHVYGDYHCDLFYNSTGTNTPRLSYVNGSDTTVVTNITD